VSDQMFHNDVQLADPAGGAGVSSVKPISRHQPDADVKDHCAVSSIGLYDDVLCSHEVFGVHRGETHQTTSLHIFGGRVERYEITPSGRLELLEDTVDDKSSLNDKQRAGFRMPVTMAHTGGRRDLNFHGWLDLAGIGRARFLDGVMVALELRQSQRDRRSTPAPKPANTIGFTTARVCWIALFIRVARSAARCVSAETQQKRDARSADLPFGICVAWSACWKLSGATWSSKITSTSTSSVWMA
jgi:hypothetical protein